MRQELKSFEEIENQMAKKYVSSLKVRNFLILK